MTAEEYYKRGKEHQRAGNWQDAIHCYIEAIELDAEDGRRHSQLLQQGHV